MVYCVGDLITNPHINKMDNIDEKRLFNLLETLTNLNMPSPGQPAQIGAGMMAHIQQEGVFLMARLKQKWVKEKEDEDEGRI